MAGYGVFGDDALLDAARERLFAEGGAPGSNSMAANRLITVSQTLKVFSNSLLVNSFGAHVSAWQNDSYNPQTDTLIIPIVGSGLTEDHIVLAVQEPGDPLPALKIFDSKRSDGTRFVNPGFWSTGNPALAFLRYLVGWQTPFNIGGRPAEYHVLGTQSQWDGVSCGAHVVAMIKAIRDLDSTPLTRDNILRCIQSPVTELNNIVLPGRKFATGFRDFIKEAWEDTEPNARIIPYSMTPMRFFTALPARIMAETFRYVRNKLIEATPKNWFTQTARSAVMLLMFAGEGIFRGIAVTTHTVFDPGWVIRKVRGFVAPMENSYTRIRSSLDDGEPMRFSDSDSFSERPQSPSKEATEHSPLLVPLPSYDSEKSSDDEFKTTYGAVASSALPG